MPQIFRFGSYWVYFWTNENKPLEPIHVHISSGSPSANATKLKYLEKRSPIIKKMVKLSLQIYYNC